MDLRALMHPTVLVVAVTYGILLRIAVQGGVLGFWLRILILLSLWRYSYFVLWTAARGSRYLPPPGPETMRPISETSLILHFVFFFLLLFFLASTPYLGQGLWSPLRWVAIAGVLAAFPASAAIMGITRNLAAAVNPQHIATVIRVLGGTYWKLAAASVGLAIFEGAVETVFDSGLALVITDIVIVWTVLAFFALTGAAIGAHRDDFDFPGEVEQRDERDERDRQRGWKTKLEGAYASIRGGLPSQGYRAIKELLAAEGESLEIYQWAFNQMFAWEDKTHALELGQKFIARLLAEGRKHNALELAMQCRAASSTFVLPPDTTAQLVEYARSVNRQRLADELERPPASRSRVSPRAPSP